MPATSDLVHEFMRAYGQKVSRVPTVPDLYTRILRVRLIAEELCELADAMGLRISLCSSGEAKHMSVGLPIDEKETIEPEPNIIAMADALADLDYVVAGTFLACGMPQELLVEEVHASNMTKLGEDGRPIHDEHGKVRKGPRYAPPKIQQVLEEWAAIRTRAELPDAHLQEYVLRWHEIGMRLVGPFPDRETAVAWSKHHDQDDDPRWVCIRLKRAPVGVALFEPELRREIWPSMPRHHQ